MRRSGKEVGNETNDVYGWSLISHSHINLVTMISNLQKIVTFDPHTWRPPVGKTMVVSTFTVKTETILCCVRLST